MSNVLGQTWVCKCQCTEVQLNAKSIALNFCTFPRAGQSFCSATNHHKQNTRAVSFHIIAQPENVHYALVFLGAQSTTLNHERKAVWEVQMVLSLTPQHSDHSQGACTYRQCRPFLLRRRWHRKKKRPSLQTPRANTQTVVTLRVPNPSFLLLAACCPSEIKETSLNWCFHAIMHAHFGQLLKCKWKLFQMLYFI